MSGPVSTIDVSGPVSTIDTPLEAAEPSRLAGPEIEVWPACEAIVGAMRVRRSLPRRERRMVGGWCFADHMGPASVTETVGIDIGPHPHMGLHTLTWLLEGEVLHRDSLGSEQVIRPGQLNVMTAGHGVAHSEEATGAYRGQLHGVQLWVAQPEATRHGPAAFAHHAELPHVQIGGAEATILVGALDGRISPVRADTPLLAVDAELAAGTTELPLEVRFEHAVLVLDGTIDVEGHPVRTGDLAYVGPGHQVIALRTRHSARLLLLGGAPFDGPILMWWNFVARSRAEVELATREWNAHDPRFGSVVSSLDRIPAPPIPEGLRR